MTNETLITVVGILFLMTLLFIGIGYSIFSAEECQEQSKNKIKIKNICVEEMEVFCG